MDNTDFIGPGGACSLTQWGVIKAVGEDSVSFLHAQLTNDVQKAGADHARWAAYCTAQGRMSASFVVSKRGPDEVWMACPAEVLPATLKRLSMFVLRAKTRLSDASAELAAVGLAGSNARVWLAAQGDAMLPVLADSGADWAQAPLFGGAVIRLPAGQDLARWLWLGPVSEREALLAALPPLTLPVWQWLEVRSGVAPVVAATVNLFVPQMLNYELVGGVDFKKGCYPGQEIVARSHYLGKLKRRAFLVDADVALAAGQEIFWSEDPQQPAGIVALAAPHPQGGWSAVVELKLAASASGSLHLGSTEGPSLKRVPMPYALPQDAAAAPA